MEFGLTIMEIMNKIQAKKDFYKNKPVTIAFLGDSVTQGCFECYTVTEDTLETVYDYKSVYSTRLKEIINLLYPQVQINIINSGISGDCAANGLKRLKRDVLAYKPDLCVVSYGLNDSCGKNLTLYSQSLNGIFSALKEKGIEFIFLTQNQMCSKTDCRLKETLFRNISVNFSQIQNDGILKQFMEEAKKLCLNYGGQVCDLYPIWEKMGECGVDTTFLLANKHNHPIREYHYYIAIKLLETMMGI